MCLEIVSMLLVDFLEVADSRLQFRVLVGFLLFLFFM